MLVLFFIWTKWQPFRISCVFAKVLFTYPSNTICARWCKRCSFQWKLSKLMPRARITNAYDLWGWRGQSKKATPPHPLHCAEGKLSVPGFWQWMLKITIDYQAYMWYSAKWKKVESEEHMVSKSSWGIKRKKLLRHIVLIQRLGYEKMQPKS